MSNSTSSTPNPTSQTAAGFYDRTAFLTKWAALLKCKPDAFSVAAALINDKKNYNSAVAVIFGLSWRDDKEWLKACELYLAAAIKGFSNARVDAKWCIEFQKHYVTEVAKYPR